MYSDWSRVNFATNYIIERERREREREMEKRNNMFNKDDLENGDIIVLRNGDELLIHCDNEVADLYSSYDNELRDLDDLEDDLTCENNSDYDVVEVKSAVEYKVRFKRKVQVREMTIKEISEKLGYEVKVVKEK